MASEGALVHLHARGPQEEMLYRQEHPTPFTKQESVRSTRFAIEAREERFPNTFKFGATNVMQIPRAADMLGNVTLEIRLPAMQGATSDDVWADALGYVIMRRVQLRIDETLVHDHERLWYDLSDKLFAKASHVRGLDAMIGRGRVLRMDTPHVLYVPLKLFCCKMHHQHNNFMPLLTIPGSTMTLTVISETFGQCCFAGDVKEPEELDVRVLLDYVTLDAPERERLTRRPTPILIEDTQDCESLSYMLVLDHESGGGIVPLDRVKVDLSEINSPVKTLVWVAYAAGDVANKRYFQYAADLTSAALLVNGKDLVADTRAEYFKVVEPYLFAKRAGAAENIHMFSFALDASSWQPSGHLNFDVVQRPELVVRLAAPRTDLVVKVFALCYKHIIFNKGRAMFKFT